MEGAVRLFAGEFSQSTLTIPGEDEKSAAWIVTPSGASVRQVFLTGALVEVHERGGMLRARVADPTGGFDLVCGMNNARLAESILVLQLPSFVSISGRAQLYRKNGIAVVTIRPEHVHIIDRATRDQWIIITAAATLGRLQTMHSVLNGTCTNSRLLKVCAYYSLKQKDLGEMAAMVAVALSSVRPPQNSDNVRQPATREMIMEYIRTTSGPQGVAVDEVLKMAQIKAVSREAALAAIESLIMEDECYQPQKGFVKPL